MSTSKRSRGAESRAAKRERFAGQQERPNGASPWVLVVGLVVVVAIIGGIAFALTRPSPTVADSPANPSVAEPGSSAASGQDLLVKAATIGHAPYPPVVAEEDGAVRFPLSTFDDYQAHHYTYMNQGHPIEFFLLKSKDGVVRAAFNACDVCFGARKGYTQDGDYMVCNNCGRRFPADQINVLHGGCNPSPLTRTVEGDTLVIRVEDIVQGQDYF
jgi:hypothetical protein